MIKNGFLLLVPVLLPNLVWYYFSSHKDDLSGNGVKSPFYIIINVIENIGRAGVFLLPFFYDIVHGILLPYYLFSLFVFIFFYYTAWMRYFMYDRKPDLLYHSLINIPLPLAVFPVLYFIVLSLVLNSLLVFFAAMIFGSAHIIKSKMDFEALQNPDHSDSSI